MKCTKEERENSIKYLRKYIKPGDKITLVATEHSDRGGWSAFCVMIPIREKRDGKFVTEINQISWHVARAIGMTRTRNGSVKSYGWGLSRSFEIVYSLGRVLFPKGFIPAKAGRKWGRNGMDANVRDTDGGYALVEERV